MKITDILRKLGIFRSGSISATYTSSKDRPTEILMDDVFDAKKDLINKEDVANIKKILMGDENKIKTSVGKKIKIFFGWFFGIVYSENL